ncbi:MAG: DUF5107 domain-containing protein [Microbacterium sp.]
MSSLQLQSIRVPMAAVGPDNPLPPLVKAGDTYIEDLPEIDDPAMLARVRYGHLSTTLPYLMQDGYTRERSEQDLPVAVLENDVLRATFLLGLGGRLWSLIHKPTGRELLFRNSIIQPANLALRGAWFAGGVEWNLGTKGHTTLTCEPLHAVEVRADDGSPVLRLYEYERTRELVYSIDFSLPDGSDVLLAAVRVTNPTAAPVPLYWWTNIAVPESADVRVIAPATQAFHYGYPSGLHVVPVPDHDGRDLSYSATSPRAGDWFFDCRTASRPWIAALDDHGRGLVHVSTRRLVGRKLFVWGEGIGGRNWQRFLCGTDERYLEIQGGAATTQFEHEQLGPGEAATWVEAFGLADVDPSLAHGAWTDAVDATDSVAERVAPTALLEAELHASAARADRAPHRVLHRGSGWGALEEHRRRRSGESPLTTPGIPFTPDQLDADQSSWVALVDSGRLPAADPADAPRSYVVGASWAERLEQAPDGWETWLHRGIARWHAGDAEGSYAAMLHSVRALPTAWAHRNLGTMDRAAGRGDAAVDHYRSAVALKPGLRPLVIETLIVLLDADLADEALARIDQLSDEHRTSGRIRMLEIRAALAAGDLERAGGLLDTDLVVADLREGEESLSALWADYHSQRGTNPVPAVPAHLDFQMS